MILSESIRNMLADNRLSDAFLRETVCSAIGSPDHCFILPGLVDVHVHLREPGFSYKETIASGTAAAAKGGYTAVCSMPNLSPVPDCRKNLKQQTDLITHDAKIRVLPYGAITRGEQGQALAELEEMADSVVAFSDDGKGVQSEEMMKTAMQRAKTLGKIIAAHCEDNSLLRNGYIHEGEYARLHGHRGICSESEWGQIERDLFLAEQTGCAYHVCHISTKESVDLIRKAKRRGVNVTCETAPHYLLLSEKDLQEDGRFKMNPPLRREQDKNALIEGMLDGTIDMIATDHAPHSAEEKSRGLEKSLMGISGIETAFPLMFTAFVKEKITTLDNLVRLMSDNPKKRFGIKTEGDFTVFDPECEYTVDPDTFLSKGKATPFAGKTVSGRFLLTVCRGKTVYSEK